MKFKIRGEKTQHIQSKNALSGVNTNVEGLVLVLKRRISINNKLRVK